MSKKLHKHLNKILIGLGACIVLVGVSYFAYDYTKPFNVYERAFAKTNKENKVNIQNTLITSGEIEELNSQAIEYSVDRDKKIIEMKKNNGNDDSKTEILIDDKTLYLKIEDGKYVNIVDSDYLNEFTNNIKIEGNNIYDTFQEKIRDSFDKENIQENTIDKKIGDKDYKLKELTLVVPKEKAKDIILSYIKEDFYENSDKLIDETIKVQEQSYAKDGKQLSDEDKQKLKEQMSKIFATNLEDKLKNIEYSDITIKVGIDKSGYIRYREESYDVIMDNKSNTLRNITEYVSFGNDVTLTNPKEIELMDYEEYVNKKKQENKEEIKKYALENPDEDINLTKIKEENSNTNKTTNSN